MTLDPSDPDDAEVLDLLGEARALSSTLRDLSDTDLLVRALQLLVGAPRAVPASGSSPPSSPATFRFHWEPYYRPFPGDHNV